MEDDQAGARELVDAEAMLEGLRREAEVCSGDEFVMGHVMEIASALRARRATRGASSASTATFAMGPATRGGRAVQFHVVSVRREIAFCVKRWRWAAKCANPKHGWCFFSRGLKSRVRRPPLGLMFAESATGARVRSCSTLRRWSVCEVGS